MKEIKAFIRPAMVDSVVDAVENLTEAPGLTLSRVEGFGHRRSRGPALMTDRVKLEVVVPDEDVERVLETIAARAHTGRTGDGKIFVSDVVEAVRIRTGERGGSAVRPSSLEAGPDDGA